MKPERREQSVKISVDFHQLEGIFAIPQQAHGIVLFAHGAGSSRLSPRNNYVAGTLQKAGLATLLMDLLTHDEDEDRDRRFDISLLTERLLEATHWLERDARTQDLAIGLFGASTGAAAALRVAARLRSPIGGVVSRGGRPDLAAASSLRRVRAPTLLIVGGADDTVLELNRGAYAVLTCEKQLEIVPGATHLFEEPGALERVALLARDWFLKHLRRDFQARPNSTTES